MSITNKSANPFPGLRSFRQDEDYLFFGREEQTIELLQRLGSNRFVTVVGTSGSGKSSLVRCGLLSELLGGKMRGAGASWEVAVTHPGGNPLALLAESLLEADLYDTEQENVRENLLATLSRSHFGLVEAIKQSDLAAGTNFLLVVDQFEELFRFREAGRSQQEAAAEFVSLLLETVAQNEVPIYVVLTMRSDFIGECSQFDGLAEMVNRGEFLIPRLTREQYKRVIEGPVKVAGGKIAPRLLQRLLNDLGQQADQLPCLQHALMRTWDVWAEAGDTEALDLDDYRRVGKMAEALSLHADEIYQSLPGDQERELCRGLFEALTVKESENRGIRRPQRLSMLGEILEVPQEQLIPIIDAFRQQGVTFLMPPPEVELSGDTIIDISHESLMRVWQRLRNWVEEEAQAVGIYRRLAENATLYAEGKAGLYRDPELGIALSWLDQQQPNAAWAERYQSGFDEAMAFLEESKQAAEAEELELEAARQRELEQARQLAETERLRAEDQRRSAGRLRWLVAGSLALAVAALIAFFMAQKSRREADAALVIAAEEKEKAGAALVIAAEEEEKAVAAEKEGRQTLYVTDMQLASMLIKDGKATPAQIRDRLNAHDPATNPKLDPKNDQRGFEWNYLNRVVAGGDQLMELTGFDQPVVDCAGTAAGEIVTLDSAGKLQRWDPVSGREVAPALDLGQGRELGTMALSPDGRRAALAIGGQVHLFDAVSGEEHASSLATPARGGMIFSPDSRMLVTTDTQIAWWDVEDGTMIAARDSGRPGRERDLLSLSMDGLTLCVGRKVVWYELGIFRLHVSERPGEPVSGGEIEVVQNWIEQSYGSSILVLSPDGEFVAAGVRGRGSNVRLLPVGASAANWSVDGNQSEHVSPLSAITMGREGYRMATAAVDGTIKVWEDYRQLENPKTTRLYGSTGNNQGLSFLPGGKRLLSIEDKTIRIWELESGPVKLEQGGYFDRFAPGGRFCVAARARGSNQRFLRICDTESGKVLHQLDRGERVADGAMFCSVAFSPDNRLLAAGFGVKDGLSYIELWDIDQGVCLATLPGATAIPNFQVTRAEGETNALAFSPDGKHLVAGFGGRGQLSSVNPGDHPLLVYDVASRQLVRRLEGHRDFGVAVVFSPDGSRMASASYDGTARIWDTRTWKTLHVLENPDEHKKAPEDSRPPRLARVADVAFSPNGRLLAMASHAGNVHLWDVATEPPLLRSTLRGHSDMVQSVAFAPDGLTLASGGYDRVVRLWNLATGREILTLEVGMRIHSLDFSPSLDGRQLLVGATPGNGAGVTQLWSAVPTDEDPANRLAAQLGRMLHSEANLASRVRMLLGDPHLLDALDRLSVKEPASVPVQEEFPPELRSRLWIERGKRFTQSGQQARADEYFAKALALLEELEKSLADEKPATLEAAGKWRELLVSLTGAGWNPMVADGLHRQLATRPDDAEVRRALEVIYQSRGAALLENDARQEAALCFEIAARFSDQDERSATLAQHLVDLGWLVKPEVLLAKGSEWLYLDDGSDQGTAWRNPDFDDSSWKKGAAPLGYGDDPATEVGFGGDGAHKHITTWFRTTFEVAGGDLPGQLALSLQRDDGAVVYLNGTEMIRDNMPEGALNYKTPAAAAISGSNETKFFRFTVPTPALRVGTNVLAVEVHQTGPDSSDLALDLQLETAGLSKAYPAVAELTKLEEALEFPPELRSRLWIERGKRFTQSGQQARADEYFAKALALLEELEKSLADEKPATPDTARKLRELLRQKAACYRAMGQGEKADAVRNTWRFPPRPADLDARQIDLSAHYNFSLYDYGEVFGQLPETFKPLKGVGFDLRGKIDLDSGRFPDGKTYSEKYKRKDPTAVTGIRVGQSSPALHFLISCMLGSEERGVEVASFVMHYADGTSETLPVRFLDDVVNWNTSDPVADSLVGWRGNNIVLSELVWQNPHAEKVIESIDFISAEARVAPFLLGITLE